MTASPPPTLYHRWMGWHAPAMRRAAVVVVIGLVVAVLLLGFLPWGLALVGGWDAAALTFLMIVWPIILRADSPTPSSWPPARIRRVARRRRCWSGRASPASWVWVSP